MRETTYATSPLEQLQVVKERKQHFVVWCLEVRLLFHGKQDQVDVKKSRHIATGLARNQLS